MTCFLTDDSSGIGKNGADQGSSWQPSYEQCAAFCSGDSNCVQFTYESPPPDAPGGDPWNCWLQGERAPAIPPPVTTGN
ncbi:hypothetical protein QBC46DRAFT_339376 [Diplogelasinospora grovesii]|uniref:Apple domain-containing protein n=1 Tax=Diplogelasinospora grovesii TaxID=303347 RepID=A0AAN6NBC8_9PEZI|nr:hypothetical protein QBC46DRAFT_339376 [Diplogelasinospora grovesii]